MTIDQLIAELIRRKRLHGGDTPVEVTWESIRVDIEPSNIYLSAEGPLYIDADNNFYKPKYQSPDDRANDLPDPEDKLETQ